jgi:hypothetical protein
MDISGMTSNVLKATFALFQLESKFKFLRLRDSFQIFFARFTCQSLEPCRLSYQALYRTRDPVSLRRA